MRRFLHGGRSTTLRGTTAEEVADNKLIDGFSEDDLTGMLEGSERHQFRAEVSRLMDITISNEHGIDPTRTYHGDSDLPTVAMTAMVTLTMEIEESLSSITDCDTNQKTVLLVTKR